MLNEAMNNLLVRFCAMQLSQLQIKDELGIRNLKKILNQFLLLPSVHV